MNRSSFSELNIFGRCGFIGHSLAQFARGVGSALALVALLVVVSASEAGKPVRILTIGSSFAENATEFLPEIARSRGVTITITKANIGGSDLARHAGTCRRA